MPNLQSYFSQVNLEQPNLDAPWAQVSRSEVQTGKLWRCVLIHSLTAEENGGQHGLFVDLLDVNGQLIQHPQVSIGWTWAGRNRDTEPAPPVAFDKQPPEPLANLPIFHGQIVTLWLEGPYDSDVVSNLRSDPPTADEPNNTLFHKSTYLIFQLLDATATTPPVEPTEPTTPSDLANRVAVLEQALVDINARLKIVEEFIGAKG